MLARLKDGIEIYSVFDTKGEGEAEFLPDIKYKVVSLNTTKTHMLVWCGEKTVTTSTDGFILIWESNNENT